MRSLRPAALLLCVLALGCEKESVESFDGKVEEEPPKHLLAVVEIPNPTDTAGVADFLGTVAPEARAVASGIPLGLGAMMSDFLETSDVVDLERPVRMLIVDPDLADPPIAFLARAKRSITARGSGAVSSLGDDLYLFGSTAAVSELLPHAAHLAQEAPDEWRATLYPQHLVARFGSELKSMGQAMRGDAPEVPGMEAIFDFYARMMQAFAEDTETVTVSIAGKAEHSHLVIRASAREGSTVASFYAAQEPWARRTLELLPAIDSPTMIGVGTLHAGPAIDALHEYMELFLAGDDGSKVGADAFARFADLWSGEMAMAMKMEMDMSGAAPGFEMEMVSVAPVGPGAKPIIDDMFNDFAGTREIMGMSQTFEYQPSSREYGGVELARYRAITRTTDPTIAFANQEQISEVAVADGKVIIGSAGASNYVPRAIDRIRGRGEGLSLSPGLEKAIAASLQARESFLFYMDVKTAMPTAPTPLPEMIMSVGFTDTDMTMRFRFL